MVVSVGFDRWRSIMTFYPKNYYIMVTLGSLINGFVITYIIANNLLTDEHLIKPS